MAATYPYVGVRADRTRAVFRSEHRHDLYAGLCPEPFVAAIGPFRTMRAARRMAGNNTIPSVALAERYAAHIAATGVYPDGSAA